MLKSTNHSWADFDNLINEFVRKSNVKSVLEIGAGARPMLNAETIVNNDITYTISDVDRELIEKANLPVANILIGDLCTEAFNYKFDLIFSKMLLEHLPNPRAFHLNVLKMAHEETLICHFFATKYGLPSLINLFLPDKLSEFIIYKIQKRNQKLDGKFKAFYRWCLGPQKKSYRLYTNIGYEVVQYTGYIGHGYLSQYPFWAKIEKSWSKLLLMLNNPNFTSNAICILKPTSIHKRNI